MTNYMIRDKRNGKWYARAYYRTHGKPEDAWTSETKKAIVYRSAAAVKARTNHWTWHYPGMVKGVWQKGVRVPLPDWVEVVSFEVTLPSEWIDLKERD